MENLKDLIERYGNLKSEMDSYKKQVNADNAEIKSIITKEGTPVIASNGTTSYTAEGETFIATYSVSVSEDFDEDKLISKLRTMDFDGKMADEIGLIEYVPKVDMDALENAIYKGQINAAELSDCKIRKETPKLSISKKKEK